MWETGGLQSAQNSIATTARVRVRVRAKGEGEGRGRKGDGDGVVERGTQRRAGGECPVQCAGRSYQPVQGRSHRRRARQALPTPRSPHMAGHTST